MLAQVTSLNVRSNIVAAYTAGGRSEEVKAVTAAMKISAEDGFEVNSAVLGIVGDLLSLHEKHHQKRSLQVLNVASSASCSTGLSPVSAIWF